MVKPGSPKTYKAINDEEFSMQFKKMCPKELTLKVKYLHTVMNSEKIAKVKQKYKSFLFKKPWKKLIAAIQ